MGESDGGWQRMVSFFPLKPFHGSHHPALLGVGADLVTLESHNPAVREESENVNCELFPSRTLLLPSVCAAPSWMEVWK